MNMRPNIRPLAGARLVLGSLLALVAAPVFAQSGAITSQSLFFDDASQPKGVNYLDAQAGMIYNDNVALVHDGSGDELAMIGLIGDTKREGAPRFDYHLDSDIALVKYLSSSYDTQPFGYADATGEFKIFPGTLSWTGRDSFNQAVLNATAPATPDNLESLNYISTGPRLELRPTLRTTITIDGIYSYVDSSSKSPQYVNIDNNRYGGDAKIERAFSNTLSAYVAANYDKVRFTDTVENSNFSSKTGTVGFKFGDPRTYLHGSIGYTKLQITDARPGTNAEPSGVTWLVDLSRLITPTQRITLHAGRQVTDAANLFRLNIDQPVPGNGQNQIASGEPFTHRDYSGTWTIEGVRTNVSVALLDSTDRYELTPANNRDSKVISAVLVRRLNLNWKWDLSVSYEKDDYTAGGSLKTTNLLTSLRWQLTERVGLRFIYAHTGLSPVDANGNQVGVMVAYGLVRRGVTADQPEPTLQPTSPAMQQRF